MALEKLLITGASGVIGKVLVLKLAESYDVYSVDQNLTAVPGRLFKADLSDYEQIASVISAISDLRIIVHLAANSTVDATWQSVLKNNIVATRNVFEAAKERRVKRIVFASSNHVTGFYRQDQVIDPRAPMRPDGNYGVSKAFGENLSRFYFDRYGIETACLRIGSSFPEPKDRRMLATWLSYDDLERLVVACLAVPVLGHTVVYGISDNTERFWDNTPAAHLGFRPHDNSERFRAAMEAKQKPIDANDPAAVYQGGGFVRLGPYE